MAKSYACWALGLAFAFSGAASAQTYADRIQQLDAQITLVQKEKQLQDNLGADSILSKMPKVVSVMTFGTDTKAKLMLSSGVSLTYGEGEVINSRMRVVAITPREVVVAVTPTEGVAPKRGKKVADPVLMPLEFMAGAKQNAMPGMVGGGLPGIPGTPVQGPIPPGLMQAPPPIQGGSPVAMQAAPMGMPAAPPAPSAQPMVPAVPTN